MIDIVLYKKNGINTGYKVSGHAGYDDHGYDVLCAAISVLTINTANTIEVLTDDTFRTDMDDDGFLHLQMTGDISHDTSVLLSAFEIGVTSISEEYGRDYIQIRNEEV